MFKKYSFVTPFSFAYSAEAEAIRYAERRSNDYDLIYVNTDTLDGLKEVIRFVKLGFIPVGSPRFMIQLMKELGLSLPEDINYPTPLSGYLNREIRKVSIKDAPAGWFVKPVETRKFKAIECFSPKNIPSDIPLDTEVWASFPFKFSHEYQVYVLHNKILGVTQSDCKRKKDLSNEQMKTIREMVKTYKDEAPSSYSMKIGLRKMNGLLTLIEVNDAWDTRFYKGMDPVDYANLLIFRWYEIYQKGV